MGKRSRRVLFTSESVTEGHPDKVADRVSDAVLDAMIEQDPLSHVACETLVTKNLCVVAGETKSNAIVDVASVVRKAITDVGYVGGDSGFDGNTCEVLVELGNQSEDIAMGVAASDEREQGAGDQGMMFGYACNETPELMPLPISLAHKLGIRLRELRLGGAVPWLQPDGKTQVTVEYVDGAPSRIDTVVIATHHSPLYGGMKPTKEECEKEHAEIKRVVIEHVIKPVLPQELVRGEVTYHVNRTGRFALGGPVADSGLTGRKIIVDTYGGMGRHGGGAFSGKDPSKVDRSAGYMARYIAKNIVASGIAKKCEIQLAYVIGDGKPVSVNVDTFNTCKTCDDDKLARTVREHFQLDVSSIIKTLDLLKPIYRKTTNYGHFGREDQGFHWEETDQADALRKKARL